MVIHNHVFNIQSFKSYCLVLANKFKREFVLKIISMTCFFLMKYSKFLFDFFSVFITVLFLTNSFKVTFSLFKEFFKYLGFSTFSPVDIKAKSFFSESIPIVLDSENTSLTEVLFHRPLKC